LWNFGDGEYSNVAQPEHFYKKAGNYVVEVTVSQNDVRIKKQLPIEIEGKGKILRLPNVFTPNKDGKNDLFYITSKNLVDFHITILNNEREVVYASNNPHFKWNGLDKRGKPVKEGTYLYI